MGYVCMNCTENHLAGDGEGCEATKENAVATEATLDDAEWKIEVYLDVPEHDVCGSYGQVLRHIKKSDWCARWVIRAPKDADTLTLYSQALRQSLDDAEVKPLIEGANLYTFRIHHKHSGPEWELKVNHER